MRDSEVFGTRDSTLRKVARRGTDLLSTERASSGHGCYPRSGERLPLPAGLNFETEILSSEVMPGPTRGAHNTASMQDQALLLLENGQGAHLGGAALS